MGKLKYLTIITGIISFYFYIWLEFWVLLPLIERLSNTKFMMNLPEFIGVGTFIIILIVTILIPLMILSLGNDVIYKILGFLEENYKIKKSFNDMKYRHKLLTKNKKKLK